MGGYKYAVNRVDYFSGVVPPEYDLMKQCSYFRAERVVYVYTNEASLNKYTQFTYGACGENIIVGNSAAPTNNHLDLLPYLTRLNLGSRKVYLPLSYAGRAKYVSAVHEAYQKELGSSVVGMLDFMPVQDYLAILRSCGVGIYFHERQQALGNIKSLMWNGGKAFLSETSVLYGYFKQLGLHVFSIQRDLTQTALDTPLSEEQRHQNRLILQRLGNRETVNSNLIDIYTRISNDRQRQRGSVPVSSMSSQPRETSEGLKAET